MDKYKLCFCSWFWVKNKLQQIRGEASPSTPVVRVRRSCTPGERRNRKRTKELSKVCSRAALTAEEESKQDGRGLTLEAGGRRPPMAVWLPGRRASGQPAGLPGSTDLLLLRTLQMYPCIYICSRINSPLCCGDRQPTRSGNQITF